MNEKPPASIALEELNIPHQVFRHETQVLSFEQAASDRSQRPGQIVRSILFQIRPEEFLMVLVAGREQIDWKKLRQLVGRSRVRVGAEEEVGGGAGYRVGAGGGGGLGEGGGVVVGAGVVGGG